MEPVKSTREICAMLQRIEETCTEAAAFLYLYGHTAQPDIVDGRAELHSTNILIRFDSTVMQKALDKVVQEQKEKGHPEVAVKAAELCYQLCSLEEETNSPN